MQLFVSPRPRASRDTIIVEERVGNNIPPTAT